MFRNWCKIIRMEDKEVDILLRKSYNDEDGHYELVFIAYDGEVEIKTKMGFTAKDDMDHAYDEATPSNVWEVIGGMVSMMS